MIGIDIERQERDAERQRQLELDMQWRQKVHSSISNIKDLTWALSLEVDGKKLTPQEIYDLRCDGGTIWIHISQQEDKIEKLESERNKWRMIASVLLASAGLSLIALIGGASWIGL